MDAGLTPQNGISIISTNQKQKIPVHEKEKTTQFLLTNILTLLISYFLKNPSHETR